MIVDDEILVRVGLKSMIKWEENGFEIIGEASDGNEAIAMIQSENPKIVITDIQMKGMDGIELIK